MQNLPIEELQALYEWVPADQVEFKQKLQGVITLLQACKSQYAQERESPPWIEFVTVSVRYIGLAILINGYIYRSARTGNNVLTSAINYALDVQKKLTKAAEGDHRYAMYYGSKKRKQDFEKVDEV